MDQMFFICCSSFRHFIPIVGWGSRRHIAPFRRRPTLRFRFPPARSTPSSDDSSPLQYDPSGELLGIGQDPQQRVVATDVGKLRSWFGPNGQYIRELPCPSCRGRGYTPCAECGVERSRPDCALCTGKGIRTCRQCSGDCVIWEESIDERPWEKARSSSPLKVKEDDEVDKLEIKMDVTRRSKRIYRSPSAEVSSKISRSLRSLNAKTGLFSNRMKIIHQDPILHAQRVAAIKKAKGTSAARIHASEVMKAFFSDQENRLKRSIAMKGVKYYCSHCGEQGHRRHYCPMLAKASGAMQSRCRLCGGMGHNRRTCGKSGPDGQLKRTKQGSSRCCSVCGQSGHNRRTCPELTQTELDSLNSLHGLSSSGSKRIYSCSLCLGKGHNMRTCPNQTAL